MSAVWLARHGETTWNLAGRYQGRLESMLSGLGMRQAFALAEYFAARGARGEATPQRIVASPLLRCAATARACATRLDLPLEIDERLIEIDHGTWEGRYRDEVARDDAARYRAWSDEPWTVRFDGGEGLREVSSRWDDFASDLLRDRRPTLVVTHDAVIRAALSRLEGTAPNDFWKLTVGNGAFATLERRDGMLAVAEAHYVEHLRGIEANSATQAL